MDDKILDIMNSSSYNIMNINDEMDFLVFTYTKKEFTNIYKKILIISLQLNVKMYIDSISSLYDSTRNGKKIRRFRPKVIMFRSKNINIRKVLYLVCGQTKTITTIDLKHVNFKTISEVINIESLYSN